MIPLLPTLISLFCEIYTWIQVINGYKSQYVRIHLELKEKRNHMYRCMQTLSGDII